MALRYRAHDIAARDLARWCLDQPQFSQVLHPALQGAPGHRNWRALCSQPGATEQGAPDGAAAGLFSVIVDARHTPAQVDAFCDALRLFKLGYSWGGPMSLVVPYELAGMRTTWPAEVVRGTLVRFSIGLEAVADLRDDLRQAMQVALV
jgi:cystathionine beta-lyase